MEKINWVWFWCGETFYYVLHVLGLHAICLNLMDQMYDYLSINYYVCSKKSKQLGSKSFRRQGQVLQFGGWMSHAWNWVKGKKWSFDLHLLLCMQKIASSQQNAKWHNTAWWVLKPLLKRLGLALLLKNCTPLDIFFWGWLWKIIHFYKWKLLFLKVTKLCQIT